MANLNRTGTWRARAAALATRCLPDTLFGRLAVLLAVAVISSHMLALTLLFEMRPDIPPVPMVHPPLHPPPPHGPSPAGLLLDIGVRLSALLLAAWVGARWLSDPMRRLADAARDLGNNIHQAPLPESGTLECREATRVFNQMQQQLHAQMDQRDQFVAAVSHDLRTPLTRLALRVESLQDAQERQRFGKDIAEMDTMIRATLDYLRGAANAEEWVCMDMHSLVDSLVQDQQDCGYDIRMEETTTLPLPPVRAQTCALRRCIANLLDNAVRYGGSAGCGSRVHLAVDKGCVHVFVQDGGPGIPAAELTKVLQPFYRVEGSRNRHTGGVGLGLATAHDIARQHGGSLHLRNREGGGLEAILSLPAQYV